MEGSRKVQPNVAKKKKCVCDILYQLYWIRAVLQAPCVFCFTWRCYLVAQQGWVKFDVLYKFHSIKPPRKISSLIQQRMLSMCCYLKGSLFFILSVGSVFDIAVIKTKPQFLCNKFKTWTHILEVTNQILNSKNIISSCNLNKMMIWAAIHQLNLIHINRNDKCVFGVWGSSHMWAMMMVCVCLGSLIWLRYLSSHIKCRKCTVMGV